MRNEVARRLAGGLGLGSFVFGIAPLFAPRFFARLFGLTVADHPSADVAIRSVGVRDAVIGLGLWSAATHGGRYEPWILARALSDTGDVLACTVALVRGAHGPGFKVLTTLAGVAAASGFSLWLAARAATQRTRS